MNAAAEQTHESAPSSGANDIALRRKAGKRILGDEADPGSPAALIRYAIETGADVEKLERLYALKRQYDADEARKAFVQAMAGFKAEPLVIEKRKLVEFTTRDGDTTSYRHAELADVTEVVCPAMARHQLSHRWDVKQENGRVIVTCIVTHADGHSESVTMDAAPDASGKKNAVQQIASAVTYLQRYTLMALCGVAARGADDDARGVGDQEETDSEERRIELAWIEQLSNSDTLDKYATTRQAIIDDYKGQSNVPEVLRKAMIARKRELTPAQAASQ